jgi:arabinofuranan 3-O-arabinosyltransferase
VAVSLQRFTGLKTRLRPGTLLLAVISYVPLLLTHRGKLGADTKVYLYLDPAKLLRNAATVWDPGVGLGTVTHQNIGYLFPMGPYYWLMDAVGFPDWVAQRIWMGSVIFLAGLGVQYLLKTLRWEGAGATVAAVIYALSPYVLHYIYKHSVILLPFTALPWLVAFTAQSLRTRGWKYPACFAFAALCSGGINATSLLLVMLGPGCGCCTQCLWSVNFGFARALPHCCGLVSSPLSPRCGGLRASRFRDRMGSTFWRLPRHTRR